MDDLYLIERDKARREALAWGPTDGLHALPQAVQLAARIEVGEDLLSRDPNNEAIKSGLAVLRRALAKAKADPEDQERCRNWQNAYDEWWAAMSNVLREEYRGRVV